MRFTLDAVHHYHHVDAAPIFQVLGLATGFIIIIMAVSATLDWLKRQP